MAAIAKKAAPVAPRDLEKEIGAAKVLKSHLNELIGEENIDAATLTDAIGGETNLFEVIDAVVGQIGEDEAAAAALSLYMTKLAARKSRLDKRVELLRSALMNAVDTTGQASVTSQLETVAETIARRAMAKLTSGKIDATVATITIKDTPAKLVVTEEAEIPSIYWKTGDPTLDNRALTDALKANRDTLAGKHKEIEERIASGDMTEAAAAEARARVNAAFPAIPGAELSNGGATIQIRFG